MSKILLAEDDKFISYAYKEGLEMAGYSVVLATDGNEAFKKIESETPDLILLDLMMPNKDGFEVLSDLKKSEGLKKIPVIIMSNLSQDSDISKCRELGAVDYVVKSDVTMQEVIAKVKNSLKKK